MIADRGAGRTPSWTGGGASLPAAPSVLSMRFSGELWYWRGPAPFYFVTVPEPHSGRIRDIAGRVTYGWGMIPVRARIGETDWYTAMFAKDGGYVLPVKTVVRRAEDHGSKGVARR